MNFFRSEEHLQHWNLYTPELEGGTISLADLVTLFSGRFFKNRMDPDYFSNKKKYGKEMMADLGKLSNAGSFWQLV